MNTVEKITELIKKRGITEKNFLQDLELGKNFLGEWRKGVTSSYMKYIGKIADYFGVTTDYLLKEDSDEKRDALNVEDQPLAGEYVKREELDKLNEKIDKKFDMLNEKLDTLISVKDSSEEEADG